MYSLQRICVSLWQNLHRCQGVKNHLSNYLSHCLHALENSERQTDTRHLTCSLDQLGEGKGFSLCCILFDLNKNKNKKLKIDPCPRLCSVDRLTRLILFPLGTNDDNFLGTVELPERVFLWLHGHAYSEWCSGSKRQQRKLFSPSHHTQTKLCSSPFNRFLYFPMLLLLTLSRSREVKGREVQISEMSKGRELFHLFWHSLSWLLCLPGIVAASSPADHLIRCHSGPFVSRDGTLLGFGSVLLLCEWLTSTVIRASGQSSQQKRARTLLLSSLRVAAPETTIAVILPWIGPVIWG